MTDDQEARLRNARDQLIARYDTDAISPAVFLAVRKLEMEIAWLQHRGAATGKRKEVPTADRTKRARRDGR
jgi:hypothetical protein